MRKGFTLIELIVVIGIIAILAAIIAPNAFKTIEKSKVAKAVADVKAIASAAMQHYTDTGKFPPDSDTWSGGLEAGIGFLVNDDNFGNPVPGWEGPYLERWPQHPWNTAGDARTAYQWDYYDVDEDSDLDWNVEIGLDGWPQAERNRIFGLIDKVIDNSDGSCAGIFRNDNTTGLCGAGQTDWENYPSYIVTH